MKTYDDVYNTCLSSSDEFSTAIYGLAYGSVENRCDKTIPQFSSMIKNMANYTIPIVQMTFVGHNEKNRDASLSIEDIFSSKHMKTIRKDYKIVNKNE